MRKITGFVLALLCSSQLLADIVVEAAAIKRPLPGRDMTAAYMTLTNTGSDDVALTGVDASGARSIEMHEVSVRDGVSRMRMRDQVLIPAQATVRFETGGLHLMIFGLAATDTELFDIKLRFDNDSSQLVSFKFESW